MRCCNYIHLWDIATLLINGMLQLYSYMWYCNSIHQWDDAIIFIYGMLQLLRESWVPPYIQLKVSPHGQRSSAEDPVFFFIRIRKQSKLLTITDPDPKSIIINFLKYKTWYVIYTFKSLWNAYMYFRDRFWCLSNPLAKDWFRIRFNIIPYPDPASENILEPDQDGKKFKDPDLDCQKVPGSGSRLPKSPRISIQMA